MGVDTKIHIPLQYKHDRYNHDNTNIVHVAFTVEKVKEVLAKKMPVIGDIETRQTVIPKPYDKENPDSMHTMHDHWDICFALDHECKDFESGKEQRRLWTSYDHYNCPEMLYMSIGAWGHNEDIAKCLVDAFGGYADFSDCDSIVIDYAKKQPKPKK